MLYMLPERPAPPLRTSDPEQRSIIAMDWTLASPERALAGMNLNNARSRRRQALHPGRRFARGRWNHP